MLCFSHTPLEKPWSLPIYPRYLPWQFVSYLIQFYRAKATFIVKDSLRFYMLIFLWHVAFFSFFIAFKGVWSLHPLARWYLYISDSGSRSLASTLPQGVEISELGVDETTVVAPPAIILALQQSLSKIGVKSNIKKGFDVGLHSKYIHKAAGLLFSNIIQVWQCKDWFHFSLINFYNNNIFSFLQTFFIDKFSNFCVFSDLFYFSSFWNF